MHRHRVTAAFCVFGVGCAGFLAALLGFQTDSAAGQVSATRGVVVTVTAGKPSELAFKLSKSSLITAGPVTFKVTNQGALTHTFKICTVVVTDATTTNSCVGKVTPVLQKGKTASLTITLTKGVYEYLSTEPKDAAHGMKGLLGIGVKAPKPVSATKTITTPVVTTISSATTTTAVPVTTTPLVGDPVNGASVYASAGCNTCHHLDGVGPNSQDGDNLDADVLASEQADIAEITNGDTNMPAYANTLSMSQIQDVSAYVYQQQHR
jgi:mono/diheme cytochrome c family protein